MSQRINTPITKARGGMHNVAGFRLAEKAILNNKYKKARLYHLILKAAVIDGVRVTLTPKDFSKAAEEIARYLRGNNIACFGKGCWEVNAVRGLHFHFMIVLEAEHGRVDYWLSVAEDGPLKSMLRELKVAVHIAQPENEMHRQADGVMPLYQYVSKTGPKLSDAVNRISYLYKNDTKVDGMTRTYYSTRNRKKREVSKEYAKIV